MSTSHVIFCYVIKQLAYDVAHAIFPNLKLLLKNLILKLVFALYRIFRPFVKLSFSDEK
jgi:hypothetical protein